MKQCPSCKFVYADDTLEFCLEDGSRLVSEPERLTETPTVYATKKSVADTEKTLNLPFSEPPATVEFRGAKNLQTPDDPALAKESSSKRSYKILETSSIAVALAHNWWQWLYLNNQYYSTFSAYVLSANFLMWLLLLAGGIGIGFYAVKRVPNKIVPIIGLVILAVNLILFAVPKR